MHTEQIVGDKSIADVIESLIGCFLVESGFRAAVELMRWFGISVDFNLLTSAAVRPSDADDQALELYQQQRLSDFEEIIQYRFKNKTILVQALTHASFEYNRSTDCYQRLEFLGDAVLDYIITRYLYEDPRRHEPGVLTDLRSALVNNVAFALVAVVWGFHRFVLFMSPALFRLCGRFLVKYEREIRDDQRLVLQQIDGGDEQEEVPKILGDVFESVAGAIFLDSGCDLNTVWRAIYRLLQPLIADYSETIPKSPVRDLLEREPESTRFHPPEKTGHGRVRVVVTVSGKGEFVGYGRSYRIAKTLAARKALKALDTLDALVDSQ